MNYPEYRRLGLPLTSSHIESTIKQIAARVKGSEKFWSRGKAPSPRNSVDSWDYSSFYSFYQSSLSA